MRAAPLADLGDLSADAADAGLPADLHSKFDLGAGALMLFLFSPPAAVCTAPTFILQAFPCHACELLHFPQQLYGHASSHDRGEVMSCICRRRGRMCGTAGLCQAVLDGGHACWRHPSAAWPPGEHVVAPLHTAPSTPHAPAARSLTQTLFDWVCDGSAALHAYMCLHIRGAICLGVPRARTLRRGVGPMLVPGG